MDDKTVNLIISTLALLVGLANRYLQQKGHVANKERIIQLEQQLQDCLQGNNTPSRP